MIDVGEVNDMIFLHMVVIGLIPGMAAGRELLRGRTEFGVKLGLYGTFTGGCREPAFGYAA